LAVEELFQGSELAAAGGGEIAHGCFRQRANGDLDGVGPGPAALDFGQDLAGLNFQIDDGAGPDVGTAATEAVGEIRVALEVFNPGLTPPRLHQFTARHHNRFCRHLFRSKFALTAGGAAAHLIRRRVFKISIT
jgi:hypothetical protein